uniref:Uncharacterized protein n=1 Tax=Neovison vison TaxID=452646 RepID=A0A8C7ELI5_NEOVI
LPPRATLASATSCRSCPPVTAACSKLSVRGGSMSGDEGEAPMATCLLRPEGQHTNWATGVPPVPQTSSDAAFPLSLLPFLSLFSSHALPLPPANIRPTNSKARGATGSFKLVPKHKRKVQPRKTSTKTAPRKPSEAKEKVPKKPREAKKDPSNPAEVKRRPKKPREARMALPKLGAAKEKAPKKGGQIEDQEARVSEARKASQQPDKAPWAPPSATGLSENSKVKGRRKSQGGEAPRKTKAGSQSVKSTVPKGKNGVASPAIKKENHIPKEVIAHVAKEGPKAKASARPRGGGSKTVPEPLARKIEAPKGPRRPGMPTKASSSKLASRKGEAES